MLFDQRVVHRRASDPGDPDGVGRVPGVDERRAPWPRSCYLHVHASVVVVVTAKRKMDGFVCQRLVQGE